MDQILCRHTVTRAECAFPEDAMPAWRSIGWLPVDEWPAEPPAAPAVPDAPESSAAEPSDPSADTSRTRARTKE